MANNSSISSNVHDGTAEIIKEGRDSFNENVILDEETRQKSNDTGPCSPIFTRNGLKLLGIEFCLV